MKPLHTVVAICLIATIRALPENIEDVKELPQKTEPVVEAEESGTNTRAERCTSCSAKLNVKSPNEILAAIQALPGAEVHTQQSYEGCSSDKGCAGIKVKDGRIVERYGNQETFRAAEGANSGNEFSFYPAGAFGNNVFQGGIPNNGPFWWMNKDSPFKNAGGNYEKFSKSQSATFSSNGATGSGGQFGGAGNLGTNAFLGGTFGAGGIGQGSAFGAGAGQGGVQGGKGESFQSSSFESSSFSSSNKGDLDLSKNPFLNGGVKFGQSGFQAQGSFGAGSTGFGGAQGAGFGAGGGAGQASGYNAGSSQNSGFSSSSSQNTAFSSGSNQNGGFGTGGNQNTGFGAASGSNQNTGFAAASGSNQNTGFGAASGSNQNTGFGAASGSNQNTGFGAASGSNQNTGFGAASGSGQNTGFAAATGTNQNTGFGAASGSNQNTGFGGSQGGFGVQGTFGAGTSQTGSAFNQGSSKFGSTGFGTTGFAGNQGSSFTSTNKFASSGSTGFTGSSPRPFATSTAGVNVNLIHNAQKGSEYDFGQQQQTNIEEAFQSTGNVNTLGIHSGGDLQQTCAGQGYVCVHKAQCNNGVVNSNGAAVLQAKTSKQYCNVKTEICCRIELSNLSGGSQGSLGVGLATFQGSSQGGLFATGQNTQGTNSFGTSQSGSFGASQSGSNFGSSSFGTSGSRGSGSFQGSATGNFGSNSQSQFGSGTAFGSTSGSVNRGSTVSGFESKGSFGSNKFGSGFSTIAPNKGSSINEVHQSTSQSNFIGVDSSSAGSESSGIYRPGAIGSGLKPGIPYLPPVDSATQASFISSTAFSTQRPFSTPRPTTPRPVFTPSTSAPGYLPPTYKEGGILLDDYPTTQPQFVIPPVNGVASGCAAALKCTPVEFCTADGMISNTSVILSKSQESFRVPLTDCKDLETGRIGKCCRDPYYTDPWPTNQLGQWVPGAFGGNDGKYTPDNRGSHNNPPVVVTGRPPVTGSVTRNFFPEPTPSGPPLRPNQITPGFGLAGTRVTQGTGQFNREEQRRFGIGTQQNQESQISSTRTEFIQNQNKQQGQTVIEGNRQVNTGLEGQGFRQGQGQTHFFNRGKGQTEITGQSSVNLIQGQEDRNTGVGIGFGQAEIGQGVRFGQGSYVKQNQGSRVEIGGTQYVENIYRVFLQQYLAGGQCGLLNPQNPLGNRNELEVDFAEIPWQAMVLLQTNRSLLCGGVITRPDVVVTSAACVEGLNAANVLIKGGEWKLGIDEEPLPFQIVQVKHILRHPFYKRGSLENDAAILVLNENLRFANNIFPICLPGSRDTLDAFYNGAGDCIVTGWGKQVLQAHLAGAIMHSVNVSLINPGECQTKLSQEYPHLLEQYDQESCVCGQPTNPTHNICKVDTGSALACTTGDGHYVLRGVYSWDSGCQPGNQLAAFYKFDLEWYEWAIGLIESSRFDTFIQGAEGGNNRFSGQINSGVKGGQASGVKGGSGSFGQFNQFTSGKTVVSTSQGGFSGSGQSLTGSQGLSGVSGQGFAGGSGQGFSSSSGQGFTSGSGQGFTSGSGKGLISGSGQSFTSGSGQGLISGSGQGFTSGSGQGLISGSGQGFTSGSGQVKFTGTTSTFDQFGTGQSQSGGSQGRFGAGQGQFISGQGQFNLGQGQVGTGQFGGQFSQSSKYTAAGTGGSGFNAQLTGDNGGKSVIRTTIIETKEKKVYQSPPKIYTYTEKPEVVTYTTKPEYFTYTIKPKLVTYTTKPQVIKYETSGSDTSSQYVAPNVSLNPSLTDTIKGHTHNAHCKCEGKK